MFEEVLLDLRFDIGSRKGERIVITADYVQERLAGRGPNDRRKRDSA
jgi:ATP-dependent protease HslVU (ClpYQ) ATPase subunit